MAPPKGYRYDDRNLQLGRKYCPGLPHRRVRVVDSDTIDAAIAVTSSRDKKPVCVLNMANATSAGGGWVNGALAQEEAICYRSSLAFTLKLRHYPLPECGGIYSPTVLVIRDNLKKGHKLLDLTQPHKLPVISVVSVAALQDPETVKDSQGISRYRRSGERGLMEEKMRMILRMAAYNGHRKLVLGAFGCGAFNNPRHDVASSWVKVLTEKEFDGGWWEEICFAVLDGGTGNKVTFEHYLGRLNV
ncbi:MAG: hypothetical protein Q9160_000968 [Pyrenula sp. 1 TL-2023]